jgi:hypothetical protein
MLTVCRLTAQCRKAGDHVGHVVVGKRVRLFVQILKSGRLISNDNELCPDQSYDLDECFKRRLCCAGSIPPNGFAPDSGLLGNLCQVVMAVHEIQEHLLEGQSVVRTQNPIEMFDNFVGRFLGKLGHWEAFFRYGHQFASGARHADDGEAQSPP